MYSITKNIVRFIACAIGLIVVCLLGNIYGNAWATHADLVRLFQPALWFYMLAIVIPVVIAVRIRKTKDKRSRNTTIVLAVAVGVLLAGYIYQFTGIRIHPHTFTTIFLVFVFVMAVLILMSLTERRIYVPSAEYFLHHGEHEPPQGFTLFGRRMAAYAKGELRRVPPSSPAAAASMTRDQVVSRTTATRRPHQPKRLP